MMQDALAELRRFQTRKRETASRLTAKRITILRTGAIGAAREGTPRMRILDLLGARS
jgi:hypothetical protein